MELVNIKDLSAESHPPKSLIVNQELEDPRSSLSSTGTAITEAWGVSWGINF